MEKGGNGLKVKCAAQMMKFSRRSHFLPTAGFETGSEVILHCFLRSDVSEEEFSLRYFLTGVLDVALAFRVHQMVSWTGRRLVFNSDDMVGDDVPFLIGKSEN